MNYFLRSSGSSFQKYSSSVNPRMRFECMNNSVVFNFRSSLERFPSKIISLLTGIIANILPEISPPTESMRNRGLDSLMNLQKLVSKSWAWKSRMQSQPRSERTRSSSSLPRTRARALISLYWQHLRNMRPTVELAPRKITEPPSLKSSVSDRTRCLRHKAVKGFMHAVAICLKSAESSNTIRDLRSTTAYCDQASRQKATFRPLRAWSTPGPTSSMVPEPSEPRILPSTRLLSMSCFIFSQDLS